MNNSSDVLTIHATAPLQKTTGSWSRLFATIFLAHLKRDRSLQHLIQEAKFSSCFNFQTFVGGAMEPEKCAKAARTFVRAFQ